MQSFNFRRTTMNLKKVLALSRFAFLHDPGITGNVKWSRLLIDVGRTMATIGHRDGGGGGTKSGNREGINLAMTTLADWKGGEELKGVRGETSVAIAAPGDRDGITLAMTTSADRQGVEEIKRVEEEINVAIATPGDREGVLAIDPDKDGLDYLAATFPAYISGPNTRGYVLRVGGRGEVAGFQSVSVVDGGLSLSTAAGRMARGWRGRGLFGRFRRAVLSHYSGRGARHVNMMLNNVTLGAFSDRIVRDYAIVKRRKVAFYVLEPRDGVLSGHGLQSGERPQHAGNRPATILNSAPGQPGSSAGTAVRDIPPKFSLAEPGCARPPAGLRRLQTEGELRALLDRHGDTLFPDGRIIVELRPFRLMSDNVPLIFNGGSNRSFLVSGPAGCDQAEDLARHRHGNSVSTPVLSCGSYCDVARGVWYCTDLYGPDPSPEALELHLDWHLNRLAEVLEGRQGFFLTVFSRRLAPEMAELGAKHPVEDAGFPLHTMYQVEMDYKD